MRRSTKGRGHRTEGVHSKDKTFKETNLNKIYGLQRKEN